MRGNVCEVKASNLQACMTLNVGQDTLKPCFKKRKQPDSLLANHGHGSLLELHVADVQEQPDVKHVMSTCN